MATGDVTISIAVEGGETKTITLGSDIRVLDKSHRSKSTDAEWQVYEVNNIGNKFLEIMKNSKKVIISVKKAFEVKELFLSFLINSKVNKKQITILTPNSYKISKTDEKILELLKENTKIIEKDVETSELQNQQNQ